MKIMCPRCGLVIDVFGESTRYEELLKIVKELAQSGEEISSQTLKRKVGVMSNNSAQMWLRRMQREGVLVLKERKGLGARKIYQLKDQQTA